MTLELSYLRSSGRLDRLDQAERDVLEMIALGQSEEEISVQLGRPLDEVRALCAGIFTSLGVRPTAYLSRRTVARLTLRQNNRPSTNPRPRTGGGTRA